MAALVPLDGTGDEAGARYSVTRVGTTVGRARDCEIQIKSSMVSRRHARIGWLAIGGWYIDELSPTNRLCVNDVAVGGRTLLRNADILMVGDVFLRFDNDDEGELPPPEDDDDPEGGAPAQVMLEKPKN